MVQKKLKAVGSFLGSWYAFVPAGVWLWARRLFLFGGGVFALLFAAAVLALRYWLLPDIGLYRQDIAAALTQATGHPIDIGGIAGDWEGLRPRLVLEKVTVHDLDGKPALELGHVESVLSWRSLLTADVRFHTVAVDRPMLAVRREPDGLIYVAGIAANRPGDKSHFLDWLLRQHRIVIRDAEIHWQDNLRQAPMLELRNVNLRVENHGSRHQFGLKAVPNQTWVSPVDIRGDLRGDSAEEPGSWRGRLYAQLNYVDLMPLQQWLPLPLEVSRGSGGMRVWFGFDGVLPTEISTDLRLSEVKTRLAADLPELQLAALSGRLGWKRVGDSGFELQTRKLALVAQGGIAAGPTDLTVRYVPADGGDPAEGALKANGLALGPLLKLADYLPMPAESRKLLADVSPQGSFSDFAMEWEGEWAAPENYEVQGRFANLGMKPWGKLPGLSGVSGNLDATHKGGSLSLTSRNARLDLPKVFRTPVELDSLTAQVGWTIRNKIVAVDLSSIAFSNKHLSGTAYGTYQSAAVGPGSIDLNGRLSLYDGRYAGRYIPLVVGEDARRWLDRAFLSGRSDDARLRLKGNLSDFPFADNKKGIFQVTAKVAGVTLDYADGWPKIERLTGDLLFQGVRMEINAREGYLSGVRINRAKAVIANLESVEELLEVEGETAGATDYALRFVHDSPVRAKVEGFTDGMKASGDGRLSLKLRLPLRNMDASTVSGRYQFVDNRIVGEGIPALEQVNGTLEFSESHVRSQNVAAQIFGGPAVINAASQPDGTVQIAASGKLTAAGLQKTLPGGLTRALSGAADWKAAIRLEKKAANLTLESSLDGLGSSLPYPFSKRARDAVPLKIEKKMSGPGRDLVTASYGNLLSAVVQRQETGGMMRVGRGAVSVGKPAALPSQAGLWLTGSLDAINLDLWQDALAGGQSDAAMPFDGVAVTLGRGTLFDREFHDIRFDARILGRVWATSLQSREITGDIRWDPQGRGKITARLKHLEIPPDSPSLRDAPPAETAKELPTLDVVVDTIEVKQKKLGRLEILANYDTGTTSSLVDDAWVVDRFRLGNPDYTLDAKGRWLNWMRAPRTNMNFHLDVGNLGRFLAMLGYPEMIARGEAKLSGQLSWAGGPKDMDFPSLSGALELEARNGQFLKVDPGLGKLIGIVSLQALPRRVTLDFRDVFSDGFAFDAISGSLAVNRGVVDSRDFRMGGPAAKVAISGQIDLANETQNLQVQVAPQLSDSVSLAGAALGGPVVGVPLYLLQKALKDPLGQIIFYRYAISGTWGDPKVVKLSALTEKRAGEE